MNHRPLFVLLAALGVFGCKKGEPTETAEPTATKTEPTTPTAPDEKDSAVRVDEKVREVCDLPTEYFAFNSTKLSKSSRKMLDELAACFVTGKAKDRSMSLVGHADPRGEEDYNFGLGQRRAASVAKYLEKKGLASHRVQTSSRGELEASGVDDSSWSKDRRVDILFAD